MRNITQRLTQLEDSFQFQGTVFQCSRKCRGDFPCFQASCANELKHKKEVVSGGII